MTITDTDTQMFGCTEAELEALVPDNIYARILNRDIADLMLAMSILSDAQEVLARGDAERARQYMNRSKFVLSKCMDKIRGEE